MRLRPLRHTAIFIALIAFALRSVIPVGFMPDTTGHKALVICDGVHHDLMHKSKGVAESSVCPFTVAGIASFAGVVLPPLVLPVFPHAEHEIVTSSAPAKRAGFASSSPRSPPFFS